MLFLLPFVYLQAAFHNKILRINIRWTLQEQMDILGNKRVQFPAESSATGLIPLSCLFIKCEATASRRLA